MIVKIQNPSHTDPAYTVSVRCPACNQLGTFERFNHINDLISQTNPNYILGNRRCPNSKCRAHIFFVINLNAGSLEVTYPTQRIDFDTSNIPPLVLQSMDEALTCHANSCYKASAIMVRKTLEELCSDRGATGSTLKDRISALSTKTVLPKELLEAMDHLRLLGNDAAHVESKEYDKIEKPEVEAAIAVSKEVLKAVYQYEGLLGQLRVLRKNP